MSLLAKLSAAVGISLSTWLLWCGMNPELAVWILDAQLALIAIAAFAEARR